MKYTIFKKTIDLYGRNEWSTLKSTKFKSKAVSFAKLQSKKYLETEVIGLNEENGEIEFHAFFRKGKLQINMNV